VPHLGQTATLLNNGKVLIAGGDTASAELFNPSTGAFTATGSMTVSRSGHTATLLPDGRVLIAGGILSGPDSLVTASAELYDPVSGGFTSTGSMSEGRYGHTATLLLDGTVLVAGTDSTADLFSAESGTFSEVGELQSGIRASETLRSDGTVLIAGGQNRLSLAMAELFAPESGGFVATGPLRTARDGHAATLLADGAVLITGGTSHTLNCHPGGPCTGSPPVVLSSAELFR